MTSEFIQLRGESKVSSYFTFIFHTKLFFLFLNLNDHSAKSRRKKRCRSFAHFRIFTLGAPACITKIRSACIYEN